MSESTIVKTITTFFGACVVYAIGGFDVAFSVLFLFMILDYVSGLMKAYKKKELSSKVGWDGLMKKIGTLLAVIVAHQMDKIAPAGSQAFRTIVITFFTANEAISITENLAILGVPIPKIMKQALKAWKDETEVD